MDTYLVVLKPGIVDQEQVIGRWRFCKVLLMDPSFNLQVAFEKKCFRITNMHRLALFT